MSPAMAGGFPYAEAPGSPLPVQKKEFGFPPHPQNVTPAVHSSFSQSSRQRAVTGGMG